MKRTLSVLIAVLMLLALATAAFASGEPSAEPSGEPSGETKTVEEAFVDYIYDWLYDELEVNANLTVEQIEDEFMPLVREMNFTDFPAEMLYSGMLEQGCPMTFEEFAAQYKPAASGEASVELSDGGWPLSGAGDTSMDAFKSYLKAYMDCVPEMDGHEEELYGLIDAESWAAPVAMAWENWFEENAMTYDEFVAANGVYSLHLFGLTSPAA